MSGLQCDKGNNTLVICFGIGDVSICIVMQAIKRNTNTYYQICFGIDDCIMKQVIKRSNTYYLICFGIDDVSICAMALIYFVHMVQIFRSRLFNKITHFFNNCLNIFF